MSNIKFIENIANANRQFWDVKIVKMTPHATVDFSKALANKGISKDYTVEKEIELHGNIQANGPESIYHQAKEIAYDLFIYCLAEKHNGRSFYNEIHNALFQNPETNGLDIKEEDRVGFFRRLQDLFKEAVAERCTLINYNKVWELCDVLLASFPPQDQESLKLKLFCEPDTVNGQTWLEKLIDDPNYDLKQLTELFNQLPSICWQEFYKKNMHLTLADKIIDKILDKEKSEFVHNQDKVIVPYPKYKAAIEHIKKFSNDLTLSSSPALDELEDYYDYLDELNDYVTKKEAKNPTTNSSPSLDLYLTLFDALREGAIITNYYNGAVVFAELDFIRKEKSINIIHWQFLTAQLVGHLIDKFLWVSGQKDEILVADYYQLDQRQTNPAKKSMIASALSADAPGLLGDKYKKRIIKDIKTLFSYRIPKEFIVYRDPMRMINRFIILNKNILYVLRAFKLSEVEAALYSIPALKYMLIIMGVFATAEQKQFLTELKLFGKSVINMTTDLYKAKLTEGNTQIAGLLERIIPFADQYQTKFSYAKEENNNNLSILIQGAKNDASKIVSATKILLALMDYGKENFLNTNIKNCIGDSVYTDLSPHKNIFIAQINLSLRKIKIKERTSAEAKQLYQYLSAFMNVLDIKDNDLDENAKAIIQAQNASSSNDNNSNFSSSSSKLSSTGMKTS